MTPQQWITLRIPIPLNQADAQALAAIPGLHRRLARRIVAYRRKHGPFEHLEQLTEVRGIGAKTLGRIRPYLTIKRAKD